jgi:hypothetical protein
VPSSDDCAARLATRQARIPLLELAAVFRLWLASEAHLYSSKSSSEEGESDE